MGILKDLGKTAYKNLFAGDKFTSTFLDSSGIYKKPDYEEQTAQAMQETAKALQAQVAMREWHLTHPGKVPTRADMDVLRSGKQPKEK